MCIRRSITEEEFFAEFQKINDDEAIDGILLFRPAAEVYQ